jgi:hypothetical protein
MADTALYSLHLSWQLKIFFCHFCRGHDPDAPAWRRPSIAEFFAIGSFLASPPLTATPVPVPPALHGQL